MLKEAIHIKKLTIVFIALLLLISLTSCRQAPQVQTPSVDHELEFIKAAYAGKTTAVEDYLASGKNIDVKRAVEGYGLEGTALYWAAQQGHKDVVELLLSRKASVGAATNPDSSTPLLAAARQGHTAIVQLLLDHHAGVNAQDAHGSTALILASAQGHVGVVQVLLHYGADTSVVEKIDGRTALEWAKANGHNTVVDLVKNAVPPEIVLGNMAEAWLSSYKELHVATTFKRQDDTLVLVSLGQRDTLGYAVEIVSVNEKPTVTEVLVRYTYPETGKPYLAELNTPHALTSVPTTKPIVFRSEDPEDFVPILVDVPYGFMLYGESFWLEYVRSSMDSLVRGNIILGVSPEYLSDVPEGKVIIEGLARVFEGHVECDILDKDGNPYGHIGTQAASAAPDWGYFKFEIEQPAEGFTGIRVYSTSAKDGAVQDLALIRP